MYQGRTVFSQVLDFLPRKSFRTCVNRYKRQLSNSFFLMLRAVPLYGICATDLS